jgi:hypothetical protein
MAVQLDLLIDYLAALPAEPVRGLHYPRGTLTGYRPGTTPRIHELANQDKAIIRAMAPTCGPEIRWP